MMGHIRSSGIHSLGLKIDWEPRVLLTSRHYLREGPDYRFDEQVSFLDIKQQFGFANVRVGKWVSAEESRLAANLIFDSLADLAFILKLPPDAIGLRQTLNLDFGLGGQKGVQAHYAPHERILALAKNAGAGAWPMSFGTPLITILPKQPLAFIQVSTS